MIWKIDIKITYNEKYKLYRVNSKHAKTLKAGHTQYSQHIVHINTVIHSLRHETKTRGGLEPVTLHKENNCNGDADLTAVPLGRRHRLLEMETTKRRIEYDSFLRRRKSSLFSLVEIKETKGAARKVIMERSNDIEHKTRLI